MLAAAAAVAAAQSPSSSSSSSSSSSPNTKLKWTNLSPMMNELNQEALQKARSMISKKFRDPVDLEEIGVVMFQLQKQMSAAESQLNAAVQGKMDALKRAVDLMDESSVKLTTFTSNMRKTDERIAQTNTTIANYEHLKRVHNVRDNLQKVIAQVEFFARVPERVAYLKELLDSEPERIKEVFLEGLKLDSLRLALVKEIKVSRNRKYSVANNKDRKGDYSEEGATRIRKVIEQHLRSIPELMKDIKDRLNANIDRIWDLAQDHPADVVCTFEIIEMHQQYFDRTADSRDEIMPQKGSSSNNKSKIKNKNKNKKKKKKSSNNKGKKGKKRGSDDDDDDDDDDSDSDSDSDYDDDEEEETEIEISYDPAYDAKMRFRQNLVENIEATFENIAEEASENNVSTTSATIKASGIIFNKVFEFKDIVEPCIPPHYEFLEEFLDVFEDSLVPAITKMQKYVSKLDPSDILEVIDWIHLYNDKIGTFEINPRESCLTFSQIAEEMLQEYLQRNKSLIMEWFNNIRGGKVEVQKEKDGTLITDTPERMFFAIHQQVALAKAKLPPEHLKDLVNACLQVLRDVQRESYDTLARDWRKMELESLVATINDTQRMQEKTEELSESIIQLVPQEMHRDILSAYLEEVSNEYISIAVNAVSFLARYILENDLEQVFSKIFSSEWESGGELISTTIVGTLNDYFEDIKIWLPEYFFSKLVREILTRVTGLYIMALRRHGNGFKFRSEFTASSKVVQDWEVFIEYFETLNDILRQGGLRTKGGESGVIAIREELSGLKNLAPIISSIHVSGVEENVKSLYERWGGDGHRLVLAVFHANPHMNKADKTENIEISKKIFEKGVAAGTYKKTLNETYKYPDDPTEAINAGPQNTNTAKPIKKRGFFG